MSEPPRRRPSSDPADLIAMQSLVDGDVEALRPLIARWEKRLLAFVYRYTQDTHASRDIVQDVFVRLYTRRDQFKPELGFTSWLFTIAVNLCRNRSRWKLRHPEISWEVPGGFDESAPARLTDARPSPAAVLEHEDQLQKLKQIVLALPHDLKTAVLLHHYEGLPVAQIADIVGCSVRGVETRLYRALKRLRQSSRTTRD